MRQWFSYSIIWNGANGELPNVALSNLSKYYTQFATGHFVDIISNKYIGYVDCDTQDNIDIIFSDPFLARFNLQKLNDDEVCKYIDSISAPGKILTLIDGSVTTLRNAQMIDGFPSQI